MALKDLVAALRQRGRNAPRLMIAVAGPPGAGKSTLSRQLADALGDSAILQADGFHFDDMLLDRLGKRHRKGAPDTFDVDGLDIMIGRLRRRDPVLAPIFDRRLEIARAAAIEIEPQRRYVIVEGNYLALNSAPWNRLRMHFDVVVFIDVQRDELERRLVRRWTELGSTPDEVHRHVVGNDLLNVDTVLTDSGGFDFVVTG
ncbi:MAG: nucleoside/nucleotide kinase family protein [Rhizobiaceae bacterium]